MSKKINLFPLLFIAPFLCLVANATPVHISVPSGFKYVLSGNVILSVTGNLTVNGTFSASSSSTVKFCGTALQQIGGSSGVNTFQNVVFNNSANFKLLGDVTVNGITSLSGGIVCTGTKTLILPSSASFSPATGSATSFIDGKIKKTGNNASFIFPTGDIQEASVVWAPVEIAAWDNSNDFTAHYTFKSPNDSLGIHTWQDGYSLDAGLDHVSGKEFWLIDRTGAGTQTPTITLYWKDAVKSDILGNAIPNSSSTAYDADALADLTLVHWNGSQWDDMGGTASGTWPTGQITNTTAFSSYSPITFGSKTGKNPLPIELLAFSANCNNNNVVINWETASETNNSYFSVERSTNAQDWYVIATIQGAGNSNQNLLYSYTDTDISEEGLYYYRLGNIDYNGVIEYSNTVSTSCNKEPFSIISIYPNPVINEMHFMVCSSENTEVEASVTDVLGRVLILRKFPIEKGVTHLSMNVSNLNCALYFFKINTIDGLSMDCKQLKIGN
ncbi:MAG: hypothetical protein A2275_18600 [Bacteroidetes bacterium RIFOXYA12_FULL_35_11]|nr:MAG: hypothetical protein A2X01_01810 [Bacteroidetes bacterium GWF2_35_48]OFY73780.1 MAG: hypothetical protein A2275_18600 [Bacteroidetes bacterium RIFOXYA12_FULL_35_11]OFY95376.1 MAG: hypothetical protein A2309_01650 [Bacteroidetes bacterium RIFOXYB2_FULL_35_7]OFY97505.1 MAG: hypothetical protein A2491_00425 [Bacteroidetes bacterium RIFOXYC12_FULL_35_7]HBX51532.1 hypothetical protein [Bacteroidales bacterium]